MRLKPQKQNKEKHFSGQGQQKTAKTINGEVQLKNKNRKNEVKIRLSDIKKINQWNKR